MLEFSKIYVIFVLVFLYMYVVLYNFFFKDYCFFDNKFIIRGFLFWFFMYIKEKLELKIVLLG